MLQVLALCIATILLVTGVTNVAIPQHCTAHNNMPDRTCTPGTINPNVTQQNLKDTVCKPGYSSEIRPPVSYTNKLKTQLIKSYGLTGKSSDYELDHLIPLSIGGAPKDPKNLWPEKWTGKNSAKAKDAIEDKTHRELCKGNLTLVQAQAVFLGNWTKIAN